MSRDALHLSVIRTFADKRTETLFVTGGAPRVPADVARRAVRKLEAVDAATRLDDLRVPPGNRLEALRGDRVCFRFTDGDAYDVEFCDCHS